MVTGRTTALILTTRIYLVPAALAPAGRAARAGPRLRPAVTQ